MKSFISQIIASILGLYIAISFVNGVKLTVISGESSFLGFPLTARWEVIIIIGFILGLLLILLKPILNVITIPLKLLTFGFLGLVISMAIIKITDLLFRELTIAGIFSLFWTALIIWGLNVVISFFFPKRRLTQ